ncbi:MAG: hypothetical protein AAGC61_01815 [Microbacterium sp.]
MGTATDFTSWAVPNLELTLGERIFVVRPPSVDDMGKLLACAVRGEVGLGIVNGPIPPEVQGVLDSIKGEHPALGATYHEMVAAEVPATTIDRMAYYAVFYWARGKDYADRIATLLWGRETLDLEGTGEPAPKA